MLELVLHRAKFLHLVHDNCLIPALKSFSDTLLFYYIGHMALCKNPGHVMEIGVGGSTHVCAELSHQHQTKFIVVDMDRPRLDHYTDTTYFPQANIERHAISSLKLNETAINNIAYCHLDGSKDYRIAMNDLEYCTQNLSVNGLICQDDYGNNKWPTVTDAVHAMIEEKKLIMLLVGDSSAWLCRPESYTFWMEIFGTDYEFQHLAQFLNVQSSTGLHKEPQYLYMQSPCPGFDFPQVDDHVLDYYDCLLTMNHPQYLQMPYQGQSMPGIQFRTYWLYELQANWDHFKGESWPHEAPTNKKQIDDLPDWVKTELAQVHHMSDLYAKTQAVADLCVRPHQRI